MGTFEHTAGLECSGGVLTSEAYPAQQHYPICDDENGVPPDNADSLAAQIKSKSVSEAWR